MHYVFFVVSALAGAAGFALLRWSASSGPHHVPAPPPPLVAEPTEPSPSPPPERTLFARPLRITIAVDRPGQDSQRDGASTITLPADAPAKTTTYVIASVEVEVNDFFAGFTAVAQRASGDLHDCDVVVRGDGSHVSNSSRRVLTRATMPLRVLMEDNPALAEDCARALVDPTHRRAFEARIAEAVREGGVLRWLEHHESTLAQPPPDGVPTTPPKPLWQPRRPPGPPDQRKWPFVFEQPRADDRSGKAPTAGPAPHFRDFPTERGEPTAGRPAPPRRIRVIVLVEPLDPPPDELRDWVTGQTPLPPACFLVAGGGNEATASTAYRLKKVDVESEDFFADLRANGDAALRELLGSPDDEGANRRFREALPEADGPAVPSRLEGRADQGARVDLGDCDVVVQGERNDVRGRIDHVVRGATTSLGTLLKDDAALTARMAGAVRDPAERNAFDREIGRMIEEDVLGRLERRESTTDHPSARPPRGVVAGPGSKVVDRERTRVDNVGNDLVGSAWKNLSGLVRPLPGPRAEEPDPRDRPHRVPPVPDDHQEDRPPPRDEPRTRTPLPDGLRLSARPGDPPDRGRPGRGIGI